jgi:hypothetical protein
MATFTFVPDFVKRLGDGEIDLTTTTGHVFKVALTDTDPSAQNDLADLTQPTGGSYAPITITHAWSNVSGSTYRFAAGADIGGTGTTFEAVSTSITTFRYAVLYDDTHASDAIVGFWDRGSSTAITAGNYFKIDLDANFEIFTLAPAA